MLANLHVKNLALIEEADISFKEGLNIITGETGAGKSIVIGSINYCLGEKASPEVIREGAEYALIELVFQVDRDDIVGEIKKMDLPIEEDGVLILSRKIMPGRSAFKVCGETVTARQMKEIATLLIDIHGQHEHQSLLSEKEQAKILDAFAPKGLLDVKKELAILVKEYNSLKKEKEDIENKAGNREREISLARYEVDEIEAAALIEGEEAELEKKYNRLKNSKKIMEYLGRVKSSIAEENGNAIDLIGYASKDLAMAASLDDGILDISNRMMDVESLLSEISRDVDRYIEDMGFGDEEFDNISKRLDVINHLTIKYGGSVKKVLEYYEERKAELEKLENLSEYIASLDFKIGDINKKILVLCNSAHEYREKIAKELSKEIENVLVDMNFLKVEFKIDVLARDSFNENGYDDVSFMISLNVGEKLRPIKDVASGGELSRIMLALKTVFAKYDRIESLIFDEIDTGISGKTAWKVSERMGVLATERQVICITHLPQIAAMADEHFMIEKCEESGRTLTTITRLSDDDKIREVSRLLGSDCVTEAALKNATELISLANDVKKSKGR